MKRKPTRRQFLSHSAASLAAARLLAGTPAYAQIAKQPIRIGYVGAGIRFHSALGRGLTEFGPCHAICDVDKSQLDLAMALMKDQHEKLKHAVTPKAVEDYRQVIDDPNINVVAIGTPDHWHTKIAIEAMRAGKDVYCEKPMTLTIREGQQILQTIENTKRIVQVGTQQRTLYDQMFAKAAAMVRDGRIGKVNKITCAIGGSPASPALPKVSTPENINWDMWLGQAPLADYRLGEVIHHEGWGKGFPLSRTHRYFRWWYEYSGGKPTDWGAHHVDIAMWAANLLDGPVGKVDIEPIEVNHPVPFEDGMPTKDDRFNAATHFKVAVKFDNGLEMTVCDQANHLGFENGIMFEGEKGRFFVNRGKLTGKAVEELEENPLPEDWPNKLYGCPTPDSHFANFVDCIESRNTPISDAASHHRMLCICHSVNIAMRLGRKITFDTVTETFVGDDQANEFIERDQRKGYEIVV